MESLNKKLIHISVPILIFHSIEEFYFGLTKIDPITIYFSSYLGLSNEITYLIGQLVLFIFLAILLVLIMLKKNLKYGAFVVGIVLIAEFIHVVPAIYSKSYYPGFFSGFLLSILGVWFWYKVIIQYRSNFLRKFIF